MHPRPSHANFVLIQVMGYSPAQIVAFLRKRGVLVRYYSTALLANHFRISAGRPADTDRLISVLSEFENHMRQRFAATQAVLFDMDGVLVDVSTSYRQCILQTAHKFGAKITGDDIKRAKDKGGFNNDWKLTLHLIEEYFAAQAGSASTGKRASSGRRASSTPLPTLEQVTAAFEELYNGDEKKKIDGLWKTERCLIEPELFARLRAWRSDIKFGIVTGRPRAQAIRFLQSFDLEKYFSVDNAIVCMEDGPAKPDPFPIQKGLELLGGNLRSVVMIGDTVDDIRASLAASSSTVDVIGVGIPAPSHANETSPLLLAGASLVINNLNDLLMYLK